MPSVRFIVATVIATLALAGQANAASFYVDDNGPGPPSPGCQDAGHPCSTINAALTASRALAGTGDTINVAAGTYAEDLAIDQPQDDGLTIAGPANSGLLNPAKIQLANSASQAIKLGSQSAPLNTDLTLSDLDVVVPAGSGSSKQGINATGVGLTLDNVVVSMAEPASTASGLSIVSSSGTTTLDHVIVVTKADAPAVILLGPATTVGTQLAVAQVAATSMSAGGLATVGGTVHLTGSVIRLPAASAAYGIGMGTGQLTLDSSLLEGGKDALLIKQTQAATSSAVVRRSTIDAGTPGVDDGSVAASSISVFTSTNGAAVATADVTDSLIVDEPAGRNMSGVGTATVTCQNSIVPQNPQTANVVCGSGAGNRAGDPAALFTDAANYDYTLKPDSPAVDAGSASGPDPAEPTVDFAGHPRSVDGNFDCVARPDLGAYELQGQSNTAPTVSAAGPSAGQQGDVLHFSADGFDAEDGSSGLTYQWVFSDGATGTGALVQHAFTKSGAQTAVLTVKDTHGCTATAEVDVAVAAAPVVTPPPDNPPPPPTADTTPPVISKVGVKARRLRLTLSEAATVQVVVARKTCAAVKGKRRCRYRTVKRLTLAGKAGANSARLPARAKLPAGPYRVTLTATDAAANRAKAVRVAVRVR